MGLHVEATTVRHPEGDVFDAFAGRQQDGLVEQQDQRVEAFDRELLGAEEGALEERFETLDPQQANQLSALLIGRAIDPERARFDRLAEPDAFAVRAQVLDLVGDRAAVNIFELFDHLGECGAFNEHAQRYSRYRLQCSLVEFQKRRVESRVAGRLRTERVEARSEVSVRAERLDE